jgi:hypothetical protein
MSEGNCSHCGQTFPVRSLFDLNGATFCERCVKVASKEARERRLPSLYMPLINLLAIVSLPLAAILVVLNYARVVWADLGYGIAVGVLGPIAIFRALAR